MSRDDYEKWQPRYATGRGYGTHPDSWMTDVAARFLPTTGTAVDLAGGSGRHACWLAAKGLDTTVVDIAPAGLELARERAQAHGLSLDTRVHDLDDGLPDGRWDVVVVSFFLIRPLLDQIHRVVEPGGVFVYLHPTRTNLERHDRPSARWLLEPGEVTHIEGLQTLHHEESWREGRHELRFVGRRVAR